MQKVDELKKHLKAGRVYRRAELEKWSTSVDRHLKLLVQSGKLKKLSPGVYSCSKQTSFGAAPPSEKKLLRAFLKDNRFLATSFNAFNTLGVGLTQLHNERLVYNHKRHGKFKFGNQTYTFLKKPHFPQKLDTYFLLVDLVNNLQSLGENTDELMDKISLKACSIDFKKLRKSYTAYGSESTKKYFATLFGKAS